MLTKVHHVGIAVRSAGEALKFYRDFLGLTVSKDAVLEEQGIRGVLLSLGESEIELLEPLREETPVGRFLQSRGEGLHHLCFETDEIEAELDGARSRGLRLVDQRPRQGLAGQIAFLHPSAACGVLVEYAQPPAGEEPVPAAGQNGIGVTGFDHLAVAVLDLDESAAQFGENLSLHEESRAVLDGIGIRRVSFPIGHAVIELITPVRDDTPQARFLRERGEGMYLISLTVRDLESAVRAAEKNGIRTGEMITPRPGTRFNTLSPRYTNGVLLQLIEHATGGDSERLARQ